ncbi:hypothetical protein Fcan01_04865 [Folsomia candida]|uniref:Uncharacterized protein n=1 Tax=Folsomia candida TaxID=158441 RepID=A0A226EUI3_FOLCA|nr:hypothetical protein Fcan01_04865 [Folsomia candida]
MFGNKWIIKGSVCWILAVASFMRLGISFAEVSRNFEYWQDSRDPWVGLAVMMSEIGGIQCQRGFYNQSDLFIDAVYHCANLEHVQRTRKVFSDERVDWDGDTPMICLKTCVARESGAMNDDSTGLDRERTRALFFEGMLKPGGNMTTRVITEELLKCDKKHPTVFPQRYTNCTNTEEVFKCYGKAFNNCRDRKESA